MAAETGFWSGVSFLGLWAIMGPTLAAVISAWWSRKLRKEDREYQQKIDEGSRQEERGHETHQRSIQAKKIRHENVLNSCREFIVHTRQFLDEFTDTYTEYLVTGIYNPTKDLYTQLRNKINQYHFDIDMYSDMRELTDSASHVKIAMFNLPDPKTLSNETLRTYTKSYMTKENKFINIVKKYMEDNKIELQR